MNLVKSTGNGMSSLISNNEERKRAMQRKDAGDAYRKQAEYFQPKTPSLAQLEDLLLGRKEREKETPEVRAAVREFQQIEYSQQQQSLQEIKGPHIPVQTIGGPTLDNTVALLEKVRSSALAPSVPSTQDLRIAASASAKIQQVHTQITLNEEANRQISNEVQRQVEDELAVSNRSVPSDFQSPKVLADDLAEIQKKRFVEQAIAKYSYQVQMTRYGFAEQQPSFFRVA
ncbi:hypothetical protein [Psychrobacillus sp.]|uniref:hypothetical protein n=1 Tax=Psychrobacillus sp. TaxID=1871623 RepID=UPI0028BEA692|nr:hypothetical protein [Psychrobacillus sp.]